MHSDYVSCIGWIETEEAEGDMIFSGSWDKTFRQTSLNIKSYSLQ